MLLTWLDSSTQNASSTNLELHIAHTTTRNSKQQSVSGYATEASLDWITQEKQSMLV